MTITSIPAPRVPIIDQRTGLMSREWFLYFLSLDRLVGLSSDTVSGVNYITSNHDVTDSDKLIYCQGTLTLSLQKGIDRSGILLVTNAGTGVITLLPVSGESINGEASKTLDFQWTTVDLFPIDGGYVIT